MTNKKNNTNRTRPTEVGSETRIEGRIAGEEDLTVFGHVCGEIAIAGTVDVAISGILEADVHATRLVVSGVVVGNVTVTEALIIEATGRVVGELTAPTLRVADGAQYAGRLDVGIMKPMTSAEPVRANASDESNHSDTKTEETPALVELDQARRDRQRPNQKRVVVKKRA